MANVVMLKRSAVASKVPATTDLALGELGVNTYDGKLYLKKNNGTDVIVDLSVAASCTGNAETATKLASGAQINGVTFDGSTNITVSGTPANVSAAANLYLAVNYGGF